MLRVFKKAMEEGKKEGIEEGKKEGRRESLKEMTVKLLIKKFKKLPDGYKEKINQKDEKELEIIMQEILEIDSLDELKEYLD